MIELYSHPHYTLEQVSTPWDWKTDTIEHHADLEKFEHEMIHFMHDEKGIGLAANQIGITKRFFAIQYELSNGQTHMAELDGMESKCFQHELDHLDGITFNKRVSKLKWDMAKKKAQKN